MDLLVEPSHADRAYKLLQSKYDYISCKNDNLNEIYKDSVQHMLPLHKGTHVIEIHFRLEQEIEPYKFNSNNLLARSTNIDFGGQLLILDFYDQLVILCHHLWRHQHLEWNYRIRHYLSYN